MGRRAALERARELLAQVGLSDFAGKPPTALSGGIRQRVALVRAFAIAPKLLLTDETFGALDYQARKIMQAYLLSRWRDSGATVVMVTHDLDEALMLADRLVLFTGSREGSPRRSTLRRPAPGCGTIRACERLAHGSKGILPLLRKPPN